MLLSGGTYEPRNPRSRVGFWLCAALAKSIILLTPLTRRFVIAFDMWSRKYATGFIVLSIDRSLDPEREYLQRLETGGWTSQIVRTPYWMRDVHLPSGPYVTGDGAESARARSKNYEEIDERFQNLSPVIERGTYWFARINVVPGTEPSAVLLVWLDAIAVLRFGSIHGWLPVSSSIHGARWPAFVLSSPELCEELREETLTMLRKRAKFAGEIQHPRIATIDTSFDPPPSVEIKTSTVPKAYPAPRPSTHGAIVCSLIVGSCPSATVEHYPILKGTGSVDYGAVYDALAIIGTSMPVDVVNLSLSTMPANFPDGMKSVYEQLFETIRKQHPNCSTAFVAANGNELGGGPIKQPARSALTLGVGCIDQTGALWINSCSGKKDGADPYRWLVSQGAGLTKNMDDVGTSFAAASVSGLIALQVSRGLSGESAVEELLKSADKSESGYSPPGYGAGRAQLVLSLGICDVKIF